MVDIEKFKNFREGTKIPDPVLIVPIDQQKMTTIARNRNPIITDPFEEMVSRSDGHFRDLSPEEQQRLRRLAWQR